ncbi:ureidoglycolate lyase [Cribrihabitans marinus]|uniref:Ureidoglycolate lyase n=1 Tax=Cribrihabitans marinus TaxID=1227549 RepID=A0A1H7BN80_9RHOB|nr:ureidoglycolate lyase [Cribrihabitans marinus]GGH34086.1 ureidoglycolate lyase [Cribrihabitans marinus]SEJ79173.1 ureidoglycolate lyase [Cribrihabitans marinus]
MSRVLTPRPLTAEAFAPFGDVIEVSGAPDKLINQGMCGRHHDRARLDFADGRAGISLFDAKARHLPHVVDMVERHPEGSQAFIPVNGVPMLVIVAEDEGGTPVNLKAFTSQAGQSINLLRNVWHGVLAPLGAPGRFVVVDRIGDGPNLQEHWFDDPWIVEATP